MTNEIYIIYPERRYVSYETICAWYNDAIANNDIDNTEATTIEEMAHELEDIGFITVGTKKPRTTYPNYDTTTERDIDFGDKIDRLIRD